MEDGRKWYRRTSLLQTEDYWAIWVGLLVIVAAISAFWADSLIVKQIAVTPARWSDWSAITDDLGNRGGAYLTIFLGFSLVFATGAVNFRV